MSNEERMTVKILGVELGTASDWDGDCECMTFYDFETIRPNIPNGDLTVDFFNGKFLYYDDEGDLIRDLPALEYLR